MSVPSRPIEAPRRIPQQKRGERRVEALLNAAASVITDAGYDAATMAEIAERAGASIGSLYQFFPNKESVTEALRTQYREDAVDLWASLERSQSIPIEDLGTQLLDGTVVFLEQRPALLRLLSETCPSREVPIRDLLRIRLARILLTAAPHLSKSQAGLLATVSLQVMKSMNELYAEAQRPTRKSLVREYELMLNAYLEMQLRGSRSKRAKPISKKVIAAKKQ